MTSIRDVARLAGVSIATVSHVMNETRYVSDALRTKVLEAMAELDYRPNALARSLRRGETKMIGLIIPDNANPYFAEMARIVENVGFENSHNVILCDSDNSQIKEFAYIKLLIEKRVDGAIFISAGSEEDHLLEFAKRGIPVVVVDRDIPQTLADVVLVNNEQGGYEATHYLISLGHQRIGCITGPSNLTPAAGRVRGYEMALPEVGIPISQELIVPGDYRYQGGEVAMQRLLRLPDMPSAVFACNDLMAFGAMRAIRNAGLQVPGDVSVIGFDDIMLASAVFPALTTIAQPITTMATLAVELLVSAIEGGCEDNIRQRIILNPGLTIRDSCAHR